MFMKYASRTIFGRICNDNISFQLAEKHDLQHISEGAGEQRHITVMKKSPNDNTTQAKVVKEEKREQYEEEMTTQFRSFSVLDDEKDKKHSKSTIPKKTTSTAIKKEEQQVQEIPSEEVSSSEKVKLLHLCAQIPSRRSFFRQRHLC